MARMRSVNEMMNALKNLIAYGVLFALALLAGCDSAELPRRVVHGTVTCNGRLVSSGTLRFVPIDGTPGPVTAAHVIDGQYQIEQWGGIPIGKHRVEVDLRQTTGETSVDKISGRTIKKSVRIGPKIYSGANSPLAVEVEPDGDGQMDIVIP